MCSLTVSRASALWNGERTTEECHAPDHQTPHYLRERLQALRLAPHLLAAARDGFVATPKLKLLLDANGLPRVIDAVQAAFADLPVDILCIDPIRNLFDGGPDGCGS
ncbi:hypothetical protein [Nioella halotolerans]|uniref:hypothetical protein n=1 Tax=Nioella halotolerans TaxID=2303578 RepID=UPI0026A45881